MISRAKLCRDERFLKGMGTAVALPFLDAMVPGAATRSARRAQARAHGVRLCAERHRHAQLEPELRRATRRTAAHSEAARAVQERHHCCSAT